MHALTIFIQRPYGQAPLLAKRYPHQSTRFKLRNQGLDLDQTTSPVHHSHFAHSSSASLNAAQEQGALLSFQLPTSSTPIMMPSSMSVSRDSPLQMTMLPGGGS